MADGRGGARPGAGRKPGRVSKAKKAIAEDAKKYGSAALKTLSEIMKDVEQPANARVSAATALLDRGFGKPRQAMELSGPDGGPVQTIGREMTPQEAADAYAASLDSKAG